MITPDQVLDQTLEQFVGPDNPDYKMTTNLVKMALFSRYPRRREYARIMLDENWGTPIGLETIREDGIIYAYINFNDIPLYALVGRYEENRPTFEEMPTEKEMSRWPPEQLSLPFE